MCLIPNKTSETEENKERDKSLPEGSDLGMRSVPPINFFYSSQMDLAGHLGNFCRIPN